MDHFRAIWDRHFPDRRVGHEHFWERALSRRRFIGATLTTGAALSVPSFAPFIAEAKSGSTLPDPLLDGTPLPAAGGVVKTRSFFFPTLPNPAGATNVVAQYTGDPSTIRDFMGTLGLVEFPPTGAVDDPVFGGKFWAADTRFMQGQFIDRKGNKHRGTLVFI